MGGVGIRFDVGGTLTNAGSIAALMLTTEALVAELKEDEKKAPAGGGPGGPGGMGGMH